MALPLKSAAPWLVNFGTSPLARLRLICFPYAGGAAQIFARWPQELPQSVELCAVQLPGRGSRFRERAFTNIHDLVSSAAEGLDGYLDRPYVFFGHSMGAMIAFELTRELRRLRKRGPEQLFCSGLRAPQFASTDRITYNLPDDEFLSELRRLNGTPPEVLESPELRQLLLPLLRADFSITQTYKHREEPPLSCPLTVFGGEDDEEADGANLEAWRRHTTGRFSMCLLPGDHFFLHTSRELLLKTLSRSLSHVVSNL